MKLIQQTNHSEVDYWRIRNFLREVFLLNDRIERSWHAARLDHWRWHFIKTCELTPPFEQVTFTWQTQTGEIASVLHPICHVVAATPQGEIASFCTISCDDYTRSAVTVLVETAAEHWQRGLGKAVMIEGMHRLKRLGCTRVFSSATEEPADKLYRSVMQNMKLTDTWVKIF
jgi:RimJ/RimL family protein N-acetyltransferase